MKTSEQHSGRISLSLPWKYSVTTKELFLVFYHDAMPQRVDADDKGRVVRSISGKLVMMMY
jgi:hypothetical protein